MAVVAAAYASYEHQREFALQGGVDATSAALWPPSVDGLFVLATAGLRSGCRYCWVSQSRCHSDALHADDRTRTAPKILWPALACADGWERLRRFVAAAEFPTIGAAASALGTHQSTLTNQIHRLERDLGGPLLERAERA